MTDLRTAPTEQATAAHDLALPISTGLRLRPKRPARAILAVFLVVASIVAALTIYVRIGDRQEVLAATRTVLAGEQLVAADFRVVSISTDDDLTTVSASDRDLLVGQYARVRIADTCVLADEQVAVTGRNRRQIVVGGDRDDSEVGGDRPLAGDTVRVATRTSWRSPIRT